MNENKHIKARTLFIGLIFCILYLAIGARAAYLHVFCKSWLPQKAAVEYKKSYISKGKRGTIFDRKHRPMAVSIDISSISARPKLIKEPEKTARILAKALNIDRKALKKNLLSGKSFVWVKRYVPPKESKAIKDLNLAGIEFIPDHSRFYPNKTLAAQVIGFSGIDHHGLEGIEFYYDTFLDGVITKHLGTKDALGRWLATADDRIENHSGNNIILTIDQTIQYIAERVLKETVTKFDAESAFAIVMDPKTAAVLSLAHYPSFNPNSFSNFTPKTWRNRAITDPFEPGSTMKIFLAAAAIESGQCTPNSIFYCEDGKYKVVRNMVHDTHSYGWLSLQQIIKFSSNIGAVKITEKMGDESLYNTLRAFGFGQKTGIDCPGETSGSLSSYKRWSRIDAGAISFGQGLSVSALQLITATCAIANEGILMKPYVVQAITDGNGQFIKNFLPQQVKTVISAKTANTVKRIMKTVTTAEGTGINASLDRYSVCGKTGTAQKIDNDGKYSKDKYVSSFIGFTPEINPQIAILVVVDEPKNAHYGGTVAAPAFREIAQETLNYLNIPAQKTNNLKRFNSLTVSSSNEASI